jgi:hypothetical protein
MSRHGVVLSLPLQLLNLRSARHYVIGGMQGTCSTLTSEDWKTKQTNNQLFEWH